MQLLPGFRDFFPEDCARRNYIVATWREVARRYGFVEYDGPLLEPVELYKKKSGGELLGQLFDFTDKGERHVAIRPEMTPTLARMVIARERDFKKPLRWFSASQFFRYEKPQKGRLREFCQLNCDIIGEASIAADAEMLALTIDLLRECGLTDADFVLRVSDREAWLAFLRANGIDDSRAADFLPIIDKIEREDDAALAAKLAPFGLTIDQVRAFIANPGGHFEKFNALAADLDARGMKPFYELDPTIVRGLAYYTGVVFEVFDRKRTLRAIVGGGRYDNLISVMSDGAPLPPRLRLRHERCHPHRIDSRQPRRHPADASRPRPRSRRRSLRRHRKGRTPPASARRRPAAPQPRPAPRLSPRPREGGQTIPKCRASRRAPRHPHRRRMAAGKNQNPGHARGSPRARGRRIRADNIPARPGLKRR